MSVVGIDLGTTNTVMAAVRNGRVSVLADDEGRRLLPSVVSFHPNGSVLVGNSAKERRVVDARNTVASIKRLIGRSWGSPEMSKARTRFAFEMKEGPGHAPIVVSRGNEYTLPEISAFVLKRAKQIAEQALGEPVERAVITVPASFNELQRASTKVAGRVAGLDVLRILNEPTAAALAYGFGKGGRERVAVYDFGGGTFDCTLLDLSGNVFEVLATSGDSFLGGDDVDMAIAERMADSFLMQHRFDPRTDVQAFERLKMAAEHLKMELATKERAEVHLREMAFGVGGAHLDLKFGLTRNELDTICQPFVEQTLAVCQDALALAGLEIGAFDKVILVGGSTRLPLVREKVEAFFGKLPLDRLNADEVVGIGAAIQAAALTDVARRRSIPPPPDKADPTKTTLRGVSADEATMRAAGVADILAPRGTSTARMPDMPPPGPRGTARLKMPSSPHVTTAQGVAPPKLTPEELEETRRAPAGVSMMDLADTYAELGETKPGESLDEHEEETLTRDVSQMLAEGRALDASTNPLIRAPIMTFPKAATELARTHALDAPTAPGVDDTSKMPASDDDDPSMLGPAIVNPRIAHPLGTTQPMQQVPIKVQSPLGTTQPMAPVPPLATTLPLKSTQPMGSTAPLARAPTPPPLPVERPAPPPLPFPTTTSVMPVSAPPPQMPAPILVDVTPRALVVETAGGYCDTIIPRNAKIPCERTRAFSPARDNQRVVRIRVAQGEDPTFTGNTYLGELELAELRSALRSDISIAVTFAVDASGTVQVSATDTATGRAARANLQLIGVAEEASIQRMRARTEQIRVS